jgi:hypothetical protein
MELRGDQHGEDRFQEELESAAAADASMTNRQVICRPRAGPSITSTALLAPRNFSLCLP